MRIISIGESQRKELSEFEKNQHWVEVANDRIKGITQKDRFPSKGVEQYFLF